MYLELFRQAFNEDAAAYPVAVRRQVQLAAAVGVSVPTVKRSVAALRRAGWIKTERQERRGPHGEPHWRGKNRYLLVMPREAAAAAQLSRHLPSSHRGITLEGAISAGGNEGSSGRVIPPRTETLSLEGKRVSSTTVSNPRGLAAKLESYPQATTTRPDSDITLRILGQVEAQRVIAAAESWGDVPAAEALALACRRSA